LRFLIGLDDTDSARGHCTTYLAFRIATDLRPDVEVRAYPRLVRLNPNVPFKTRGNAAVSLTVEAHDPGRAFDTISAKIKELSDVEGGANPGMVFLEDLSLVEAFRPLYTQALAGIVSPQPVRKMLKRLGVRSFELGNGMGLVGAASSLGFGEDSDRTFELIAYRREEFWGAPRALDSASVKEMDARTFPHTFNNYDYQKRKVLVAPHGPDPVFLGVRGDSPGMVVRAFGMLCYDEPLKGRMIFVSNQHTDAHLREPLRWRVYSSGWMDCVVKDVRIGAGGHAYVTVSADGSERRLAAYEPTGDLKRTVRLLGPGDRVRAFGGVRRGTSLHPMVLNLEKIEVVRTKRSGPLRRGVYLSSPRANRHLTKPLIRYGQEVRARAEAIEGWVESGAIQPRARARSR
jgi:tRNA(Ile2)-agmatinylcytidine synthase